MEEYTRDSFRAIRDEMAHAQQQRRGSVFITILIIIIFAAAGVFYVKTSKPQLWNSAVEYIKNISVGGKSLETIGSALFNKASQDKAEQDKEEAPPQTTENTAGESGDMLLTADNLSFDYLSEPLKIDLLNNGTELSADSAVPVMNATVTSDFGSRTDPVTGEKSAGHHGIDLAASPGSEIVAFMGGTVAETGKNDIYGNYVLINHGSELSSFYGHMSEVTVSGGDKVSAGDSIGIIGSTGKSTGVHLHFEVRVNGERVDPAPYIYEKI